MEGGSWRARAIYSDIDMFFCVNDGGESVDADGICYHIAPPPSAYATAAAAAADVVRPCACFAVLEISILDCCSVVA